MTKTTQLPSLTSISERLSAILPAGIVGSVMETTGVTVTVAGLPVPVGAVVEVDCVGDRRLLAEVIGFHGDLTIVLPLDHLHGVRRGNRVRLKQTCRDAAVGEGLLGRVVGARGELLDAGERPWLPARAPLEANPPPATERPPIDRVFATGIRAVDSLLTCGQGQRLGIFSAAGVGKSTTLGMLARHAVADVNVIALIGERGREVNEFVEEQLSPEVRRRTVVVAATGDEPALRRLRAAHYATTIAEYFRDRGRDVLLLMDSLTRFAHAAREIGLAAGEPPATRGFPPPVFARLPRLVERAGRSADGNITAFYTVLVEGDDLQEPIADAVRGHLDGHIVLCRKLATRGHYPAIDVLESVSRTMGQVIDSPQRNAAEAVRHVLATYRQHEELVMLGAYPSGSHPGLDHAIRMQPDILRFLQQDATQPSDWQDVRRELLDLSQRCQGDTSAAQQPATGNTLPHQPPGAE